MSVLVCTDLSGKEPHMHVGVGSVVKSGNLDGVLVSTLAQNAGDACSGATLSATFPHFHHTNDNTTLTLLCWHYYTTTKNPLA